MTFPRDGVSSPAINRSSVVLPVPLAPTRPVRPVEKLAVTPSRTTSPSGQVNVVPVSTTDDEGMVPDMDGSRSSSVQAEGTAAEHRPCHLSSTSGHFLLCGLNVKGRN